MMSALGGRELDKRKEDVVREVVWVQYCISVPNAQIAKLIISLKNDPKVFEHIFWTYQVWTSCQISN